MLKHLQKSVEEEELVWKSKIANLEEQLREVGHNNILYTVCGCTLICPLK